MTRSLGGEPYRFLTICSELKCAKEGFRVKRSIYCCFFGKIWSFRNRKMRKLFQMIVVSSETLRGNPQGDTKKGMEKDSPPMGIFLLADLNEFKR